MSESSDTGQASIVFLGRESFRMQVGDAIPSAFWEGPTEKIMERRNWERRNWDRRKPRHGDDMPAALAAAARARKKLVIGVSLAVSLATFAAGIVVATTFDRMRSRARAERVAAIERAQPPATAPAPQPAVPASPAVVVAPIMNPEPAAAPAPAASTPPAADRHAEKRVAAPKARPAARTPAAHAARPRRTAAAAPARAPAIEAATQPPSAAPRPRKIWVDPFAD